jgi:hypothetical protein
MVIDVYIWPAYRLHALKKHLGAGFGTVWRFWQHFPECLALPVAAEARVDIGNCGVILPQSRPRNREGLTARGLQNCNPVESACVW